MDSKWLKISVECDQQLVDSIVDFMIGVMEAGVEVEVEGKAQTRTVNGYCISSDESKDQDTKVTMLEEHLKLLATIFDKSVPIVRFKVVDDLDWANNWKKYFHPFAVIPSLIIAPTWEDTQVKEGEQLIIMDPGMAFGTGQHATTALSLQFIHDVVSDQKGLRVLDVGTGTGVLGMAAALFGADIVLGIDNDPEAIKVAQNNIESNNLSDKMRVCDIPLAKIGHPFPLIVANITHDVLLDMADDLCRLTMDSGHLILSGILQGKQTTSMIDCFTEKGLTLVNSDEREEWSALLFERQG